MTRDPDIRDVKLLLAQDYNIFLTGSAGTGKSYLLRQIKEEIPGVVMTASTGVAAVNIGGCTIHSFSGIGLGKETAETILTNFNHYKAAKIRSCDIIAIDEISMLSGQTLNLINAVLKGVRRNDRFFGGMRVIVVGDFMQLPPVHNQRSFDPKPIMAFESKAWTEANFAKLLLTKCWRQKDAEFIKLLDDIRHARPFDLTKIKFGEYDPNAIHIYSTNWEADGKNTTKLNELPGAVKMFKAEDKADEDYLYQWLDDNCLAPTELYLKKDSRVMLLVNLDVDHGLCNGSMGHVIAMNNVSVTVLFDNDQERVLTRMTVYQIKNQDNIVAFRDQIPLRLAWAITIHKSQGMTLAKVNIDLTRVCNYGQAYTALSRARRSEDICLTNLDPASIKVHPKAIRFYETMKPYRPKDRTGDSSAEPKPAEELVDNEIDRALKDIEENQIKEQIDKIPDVLVKARANTIYEQATRHGIEILLLSLYQYRLGSRLDLYPVHRRYHDIVKNERGSYEDETEIIQKFATEAL